MPRSWNPFWWLPVAVVLMLAWVNGTMPEDHHCPVDTDGAQFSCWLEQPPDAP